MFVLISEERYPAYGDCRGMLSRIKELKNLVKLRVQVPNMLNCKKKTNLTVYKIYTVNGLKNYISKLLFRFIKSIVPFYCILLALELIFIHNLQCWTVHQICRCSFWQQIHTTYDLRNQ